MSLACVILAAGQGKRMHSPVPKVLHTLCGRPMLRHVLDAVDRLRPERKVVVVGKHADAIRAAIGDSEVSYALQQEPRGTGDALRRAVEVLGGFRGTILVLNGDAPLITTDTLRRFLNLSRRNRDALSVLSFLTEVPTSYGRIVRDPSGEALRIVEEKDAAPEQKAIREVNSGVYAMSPGITKLLARIKVNAAKGEYYLTDLFEIAVTQKVPVGVYRVGSEEELVGVNNRIELLGAERIMRDRIIGDLIRRGVNFVDPASVYIHSGVKIGAETLIYPNVHLEGNTRIGRGCTICPNVRITESTIGDRAAIKDATVIEHSTVKRGAQIGPFAHLRPGSSIGSQAKIGNFVEVKKSVIGDRTKASHLSYIGDALVGKDVNIGAGTITCNYDGRRKHATEIKDGVFIGSDSQLVAPVRIGKGAYVGAGSTITDDVPPLSLAIGRGKQKNIEGWVLKRRSTGSRQSAVRKKRLTKETAGRRRRTED